jgi:hypothetical protein
VLLVDRLSSLRRSLYQKKRLKEDTKSEDEEAAPPTTNPIL